MGVDLGGNFIPLPTDAQVNEQHSKNHSLISSSLAFERVHSFGYKKRVLMAQVILVASCIGNRPLESSDRP